MKTAVTTTLTLLAAATLTGCGQAPSSTPAKAQGVAVIDLDQVAASVGSDKQIAQAMQQRQAALNDKLVKLAGAYVDQLESARTKIEDPEEGGVQLAQYQAKANESLGVAKRQAQEDLTKHRSRLVQQFREEVRPVARKVAAERGYAMIVTRQDSLLFDYSEQADITQAVIERLNSRSDAEPAPATDAGE